jgi:flavodoxin
MRTLVVYYSRTGITKKVGESVAASLQADKEELISVMDRSGAIGYLKSGKEATLKKLGAIKPASNDPGTYDLVIIGTPVWAWNISSPVRTYLTQNIGKFKQLAFFETRAGEGTNRPFVEMEAITGVKPVATLSLTTKEVVTNSAEDRIKEFISKLHG